MFQLLKKCVSRNTGNRRGKRIKNIHEEHGGSRQGVNSETAHLASHSPVAHDVRSELRLLRAAFRNTKGREKAYKIA